MVLSASGLTLVEMLMAMAITLIMMAAVVNLFANVGASVRNRRATIEMNGQLRMVRMRLYNDLVGATCPTLTWQRPGDDNGYLEIVEGQWSDKNPSGLLDGNTNNGELDYTTSLVPSSQLVVKSNVTDGRGLGDYDDILALTVRSEGEPFVGRRLELKPGGDPTNANDLISRIIESTLAEVIWFAVENPADGSLGEPGMRTVYRRVLLIAPWLRGSLLPTSGNVWDFYRENDISMHRENGQFVPNTLGDLTKREYRFGHLFSGVPNRGFPHPLILTAIRARTYDPTAPLPLTKGLLRPFGLPFDDRSKERLGEDVMLTDVLAFDVRVYDPGAPSYQVVSMVVEPSDAGWSVSGSPVAYGAYVDMGWDWKLKYPPAPPLAAGVPVPLFQVPRQAGWHPRDTTGAKTGYPAVYDTWSFHYENDGLDQDLGLDNNAGIDQGTNGLDDNVGSGFINGVDDMGERETAPPYDVPLRGLQVKLRVYEPDTRNIRETTVTRNFVP